MIKNVESLKIISIGANKYLILCTLDYLDTAQDSDVVNVNSELKNKIFEDFEEITEIYFNPCLLYTSPSPRDREKSRMPSSA